uniref:Uncharacterized protein n=1 Tax=Toxoplasma gondii COUG TaxID=1074873 RepID=A0A2G8Y0B7_TOXGO|nr:hypothetical protein TGCOUG_393470 [Toxoplasma gondii COUG]
MDFGFPPPETDCASREKTQRWTEHCHFMLVVCLFVETGVCSRGGRVGSRACIPVHAHAHDQAKTGRDVKLSPRRTWSTAPGFRWSCCLKLYGCEGRLNSMGDISNPLFLFIIRFSER